MRLRSLLFVPGDRPERFSKAIASGADAIILDLEDSVSSARKPHARAEVAAFLASTPSDQLWVRLNPLSADLAEADLAAILPAPPAGLMLPKSISSTMVSQLCGMLVGKAESVKIMPIATETPAAIFGLGSYGDVADRLGALTWGAEDLSSYVGAATPWEDDGIFTPPYTVVRALALFAAHAAGVPAIETVYPRIQNAHGLDAYCRRAMRDGFTGMLAIHPSQIPVINAAFTPEAAAIDRARRVLEAFEAGVGAVQFEGQMLDAPHRAAAERMLQRAGEAE